MERSSDQQEITRIGNYTSEFRGKKDKLGSGGFGQVYVGHQIGNPKNKVAIKLISIKKNSIIDVLNEIKCMLNNRSKGTIQILATDQIKFGADNQDHYAIVMEKMDGSLRKLLQQKGKLTEDQAIQWASKIIQCYKYLHKVKVIHRDLKPENVLYRKFGDQLIFKIADFGNSRNTKATRSLTVGKGSIFYMSPQQAMQGNYTDKTDVYAFGCMLFEFLVGSEKQPIQFSKIFLSSGEINKKETEIFLGNLGISKLMIEFIQGCLNYQQEDRLAWKDVFKHPIFNKKSQNQQKQTQNQPQANLIKLKKLYLQNKNIDSLANIDSQIQHLIIANDIYSPAVNALNYANLIKTLSKLKKISKLDIIWCIGMGGDVTIEILNAMPQLRQLSLLNHNNLDAHTIKKLCEFSQLRQFHFSKDSNPKYIFKQYEDYFIPLVDSKESEVPSIAQTLQLSNLPKLSNIQINQSNEQQSVEVIRNMSSLKNLCLGYNQDREDSPNEQLLKEMGTLKQLNSLCLVGLNLKGKQESVRSVIRNNKHLSTFLVRNKGSANQNINDNIIEQLAKKGSQFDNLVIQGQISVTGIHLSKFQNLKLLSLQHSWGIKTELVKQAISKMSQLTHLILRYNYDWVDDIMSTIEKSCKSLRLLDIFEANVTGKGLLNLKTLKHLSILMFGQNDATKTKINKINARDLIQLTKSVQTIRTLLSRYLDMNDAQLLQINQNSQSAISHLDIVGCKNITVKSLLLMKQLKIVRSDIKGTDIEKLKAAGIETL